jgi:hypothetical protein
MDAKKMVRNAKKALERSNETRYKSRGGLLPQVAHGSETAPRAGNIKVIQHGNKINIDDYLDVE